MTARNYLVPRNVGLQVIFLIRGKIISSGTDMMLIDGIRFKLANEEFTFKEK